MNWLQLIDHAGVMVFAATGALAASRKQLDLVGFVFLAAVTGIGGGTVRDLILDAPVFWVAEPVYIATCTLTALAVYLAAHLIENRYKALLWLDAIGLSVFCVIGAAKGYDLTGSAIIAMITGMFTATLGGILRDMIAGEPSVLLRPEIYITAALAGAALFTMLTIMGLSEPASIAAGCAGAFVTRGGAIRFGWSLPRYRPRPGRDVS